MQVSAPTPWHQLARRPLGLVITLAAVAAGLTTTCGVANDELAQQATWSIPTAAQVRQQLTAVLESSPADDAVRAQIEASWSQQAAPPPSELLQAARAGLQPVE